MAGWVRLRGRCKYIHVSSVAASMRLTPRNRTHPAFDRFPLLLVEVDLGRHTAVVGVDLDRHAAVGRCRPWSTRTETRRGQVPFPAGKALTPSVCCLSLLPVRVFGRGRRGLGLRLGGRACGSCGSGRGGRACGGRCRPAAQLLAQFDLARAEAAAHRVDAVFDGAVGRLCSDAVDADGAARVFAAAQRAAGLRVLQFFARRTACQRWPACTVSPP